MISECRSLALCHVDMIFQIVCTLGFGISLDAAAKGMGLPGKPMNDADAPKLWAERRQHGVLEYVAHDARTTMDVASACEASEKLCWIAKSGNRRSMRLSDGWLTVDQANELPEPNTFWMTDPW